MSITRVDVDEASITMDYQRVQEFAEVGAVSQSIHEHGGPGKSHDFVFEFWPSWVMYFPVAVQWIALSLHYRSITLPFLANPSLRLSGMVGVPKPIS